MASWSSDQRDFCCKTFQLGCPHTTLSPLGCDAQCVIKGQARTCSERMEWTQKHVFGAEKENACNLAYSKVVMWWGWDGLKLAKTSWNWKIGKCGSETNLFQFFVLCESFRMRNTQWHESPSSHHVRGAYTNLWL